MKLIVCAGIPRAGSHLQWQIVEDIVRLVDPKAPSREGFRRCGPLLKVERPGYVVVKVHRFWEKTLQFQPKVITSCRDPRGLIASRIRLGWRLEQCLQELPRWLEAFERWVAVPGALAMRYEAFTRDVAKTTRYMARWLDIPLSKEQAQAIADDCTLVRRRVHHLHGRAGHNGVTRSNWKEDLTAEQQAAVIVIAKDFMLRTGYLKEG